MGTVGTRTLMESRKFSSRLIPPSILKLLSPEARVAVVVLQSPRGAERLNKSSCKHEPQSQRRSISLMGKNPR